MMILLPITFEEIRSTTLVFFKVDFVTGGFFLFLVAGIVVGNNDVGDVMLLLWFRIRSRVFLALLIPPAPVDDVLLGFFLGVEEGGIISKFIVWDI